MVEGSLVGLWVAAFLAATPVPFQSEIVFLGLLATEVATPGVLILVASVGNILGSCLTYALGRWLGHLQGHKWFPLTAAQMAKGESWFRRWGVWILLFSWAPGGDIAVGMAGVLRVPVWQFVLLVSLSKTLRYWVLALIAQGAFQGLGW